MALPLHRNKVAAIKMPELGRGLAAFFCTGPNPPAAQYFFGNQAGRLLYSSDYLLLLSFRYRGWGKSETQSQKLKGRPEGRHGVEYFQVLAGVTSLRPWDQGADCR